MAKSKKKLLINQVKIANIQDRTTIPTQIRYDGKASLIGTKAASAQDDSGRVFENFKVELGRQSREELQTKKQRVAKEHTRSVLGIAKDFLEGVCDEVKSGLEKQGQAFPKKVLVAEPISFEEEGKVSGQWLANYRYAVKASLQSKFEQVDFLPEPFAVFQYYRYGLRHPLLSEQHRHVALVLDFGGGTFDVSVIETTKEGDISHGGRTSRPLAAKSIPVGGYFVNRKIAEYLLFKALPDKKSKTNARKTIGNIGSFLGLSDDAEDALPDEQANFARNFRKLLRDVEDAKVNICSNIQRWDLQTALGQKVRHMVSVPRQPFSEQGDFVELSISAEEIRTVFVRDVWEGRLKEAIKKAVLRAQEEIKNIPISVVLLSGGSTNIGWTRELIERDLGTVIGDASILELSENYQEVVAKGLAVECARQFYTEGDGDFGAVTYNRLNLVLQSDDGPIRPYRYKPRSANVATPEEDGALLPSAASLRAYDGERIGWKARLQSAPKHNLGYYYMKSSFDPEDIENLHNVVDNRIFLKQRVHGQSVDVEIKVREDGTATPSFLLNRGKSGKEERIEGQPFYLDMTYAGEVGSVDSYLGLDFGTATSAASLVFQSDIKAYKDRSKEKSWSDLSDLVEALPYPIAHSLAEYVAQTESRSLETHWKTTIEAMLSFMCYVCYCDQRASAKKINTLFPSNFNRSAGPLRNFLSNLRGQSSENSLVSKKLLNLFGSDFDKDLGEIVEAINDIKHDRKPRVDFNHTLGVIGNHIKVCLSGFSFGSFENTQKKSFGDGYEGVFRSYVGANPPFIELYNYSGPDDFSSAEVLLVERETGKAISLSPLYYSFDPELVGASSDSPLYLLDSVKGKFEDFTYIPVKKGDGVTVKDHFALSELAGVLSGFLETTDRTRLYDKARYEDR
ncbi:Hsp70 family protein [Tritonibacter mobilis]|uniref:Hsp70 family protein n=1 Tax=Tritonibacter mobilis TaxID=379347 RepID=UPI0039A5912C